MNWMQGLPRYTVTYCQYGDTRQKPTDIWTNHPTPCFKPPCSTGDKCHTASPRGKSLKLLKEAGIDTSFIGGTQYSMEGSDKSILRSVIPEQLCNHIVDICEGIYPEKEKSNQLSLFEEDINDTE